MLLLKKMHPPSYTFLPSLQCEDLLLLKKMHLTRWSRYSRHGAAVTDLHEDFQDRIRYNGDLHDP